MNELAQAPFDETGSFAAKAHFVHVFSIEAHPMAPDISPFSGTVWEAEYSTVPQAVTYEARLDLAKRMTRFLAGDQLLLVDALDREGLVNPVWCTYGPAPNAAYVIRQDGTIAFAAKWTDAGELAGVLRDEFGRAGER